MGLPLISTNWSGITAYLDESVGYPIAVERLITVRRRGCPFLANVLPALYLQLTSLTHRQRRVELFRWRYLKDRALKDLHALEGVVLGIPDTGSRSAARSERGPNGK